MRWAFWLSIREWVRLGGRLIAALAHGPIRRRPWLLILYPLIWLLAGLFTLIHWVGFALDEVFFHRYRNVEIRRPVFILGIPRSGTTWLQRVLAHEPGMTTLTLRDCLFTPSITERLVWRALAKVLGPLGRLSGTWFKGSLAAMDRIHQLRLGEPEEDFLLLLPVHACFLWVFLCPQSPHYWQLTRFDETVSARERHRIMGFYRRCLQKHLFVTGPEKRLLSKNPSFTSFHQSLRDTFLDAQFIFCVRMPVQAVASQLSSVIPALSALGSDLAYIQDKMVEMLLHYYRRVNAQAENPDSVIVDHEELCGDLVATVTRITGFLELPVTAEFVGDLERLAEQGRRYRSEHHYDLSQFKLEAGTITAAFHECWPIATATAK